MSITKIWKDAGSLPGQYQKLTISYVSRNGSTVKIKSSLYVKSNGYDYYDYSTRHNKYTIYCRNNKEASGTYQAKGNHATCTRKNTFNVTGVGDDVISLPFQYSNTRVWVKHTNSWDPRSTGVVKKVGVGSLKIPSNTEHTITFDEVVNENIHTYSCYHNKVFTIPDIQPEDSHYQFEGWTLDNYAADYESPEDIPVSLITHPGIISKTFFSGNSLTIAEDTEFFALWSPKNCNYKFYDYDGNILNDLTISHKWGTYTNLPDLNTVLDGKYNAAGYNFLGWERRDFAEGEEIPFYTPSDNCEEWPSEGSTDVYFYPVKSGQNNTVDFIIKNNIQSYEYITDTKFNMVSPLIDLNKTDITLNPGYKLIGWSTVPMSILVNTIDILSPQGIAFPNQGYNIEGIRKIQNYYAGNGFKIYPISGEVVFDYSDFFNNNLKLYPYYEYYTTSYIYYNNEWRLAMPYVYKDDVWDMALTYIYSDDIWKL